uniref:Uncharacterized protein n=1 Tax=Arundo donax TaxID=35708 RepID=A0A0A9ABU1_ARUDO
MLQLISSRRFERFKVYRGAMQHIAYACPTKELGLAT